MAYMRILGILGPSPTFNRGGYATLNIHLNCALLRNGVASISRPRFGLVQIQYKNLAHFRVLHGLSPRVAGSRQVGAPRANRRLQDHECSECLHSLRYQHEASLRSYEEIIGGSFLQHFMATKLPRAQRDHLLRRHASMVMPSQWSSQTGFQRSSGAAEVAAGSICPLRRGVTVGFAPRHLAPMDQVNCLTGRCEWRTTTIRGAKGSANGCNPSTKRGGAAAE